MSRSTPILATVMALLFATSLMAAEENVVFKRLTTEGVTNGETTIKLPLPIMSGELDAAGQKKAIESLIEGRFEYDAFVKKTASSKPHIFKSKNEGRMWLIDIYFVAYGHLPTLLEEGFHIEDLGGPKKDPVLAADGKEIPPDDLAALGIKPADDFDIYLHVEAPIVDRVKLHGTLHMNDTRPKDSVLVASVIDERFDKHPMFGNYWQSIVDVKGGAAKALDPKKNVYHNAGVYAQATQLAEPKGAIFVEYHLAFDEPVGWFGGAKLLAGKLPIAADKNIGKLRRQLAREEEKSKKK